MKYAEYRFVAYEAISVPLPDDFDENEEVDWEEISNEAFETISNSYPSHDWDFDEPSEPLLYEVEEAEAKEGE